MATVPVDSLFKQARMTARLVLQALMRQLIKGSCEATTSSEPLTQPMPHIAVEYRLAVQGLMRRPDWKEAVRLPLALVPGGTSGALAFNSGIPDAATGAYAVCKGSVQVCSHVHHDIESGQPSMRRA